MTLEGDGPRVLLLGPDDGDGITEAFYVLEGQYTFYTDIEPAEGIGPGTFVFIPPDGFMASAPAQKVADFLAFGRLRFKPRSSGVITERGQRMTAASRHVRAGDQVAVAEYDTLWLPRARRCPRP